MVIKVDHDELENVSNNMINDKELLDIEINNLLKYVDQFGDIWKGIAYDEFYNNAHNYISRMKVITNAMDAIGNFVKKADNSYDEIDRSFAEDMHKVRDNMNSCETTIDDSSNDDLA